MFEKRFWISKSEADALMREAAERANAGENVDFAQMLGNLRSGRRVMFDRASMVSGIAACAIFAAAIAVGSQHISARVVTGPVASSGTCAVADLDSVSTATARVIVAAPAAPEPPMPPMPVDVETSVSSEDGSVTLTRPDTDGHRIIHLRSADGEVLTIRS